MGEKLTNARLKQKYDTEANWIKNNPILLSGEIAISSDKGCKHKVGNGASNWQQLPYAKTELSSDDITEALGYTPPKKDTTYDVATTDKDGLMSSEDKTALDRIDEEVTDIKQNGVIDNLPVGSILHIDSTSEIPAGYELVTDDSYYVGADFIGSNEQGKTLDTKLTEIDEHMKNIKNVSYGDDIGTSTDVKLFFRVLK